MNPAIPCSGNRHPHTVLSLIPVTLICIDYNDSMLNIRQFDQPLLLRVPDNPVPEPGQFFLICLVFFAFFSGESIPEVSEDCREIVLSVFQADDCVHTVSGPFPVSFVRRRAAFAKTEVQLSPVWLCKTAFIMEQARLKGFHFLSSAFSRLVFCFQRGK